MLDGLFLLLTLSIVMALASFLAGALPLSMSLSSSQLRLISTIGMGVLVGTSLIVIIPEGVEALYISVDAVGELHTRALAVGRAPQIHWVRTGLHTFMEPRQALFEREQNDADSARVPGPVGTGDSNASAPSSKESSSPSTSEQVSSSPAAALNDSEHHNRPTFYVGFSLVSGFILMFLIDKLPRHASDNLQPTPPTRHISLSNLSLTTPNHDVDPESESFLQSLTPTPKQTRSLATTTGLVIHAAADGIAMGASASNSNTKLGLVIFIAIMVHKAPAAFGLTSVLLKQGLSKRAARGHLIIFSLAAPFGALTTWLLVAILGGSHIEGERGQWWTGILLLFSAGTFLYVAMHAMQEDSNYEHPHTNSNGFAELGIGSSPRKVPKPRVRDTMAAVGGMLLPLLTQLGHGH